MMNNDTPPAEAELTPEQRAHARQRQIESFEEFFHGVPDARGDRDNPEAAAFRRAGGHCSGGAGPC